MGRCHWQAWVLRFTVVIPPMSSNTQGACVTTQGSDIGFSGKKAAEIVGISYRQLDYWARTDLIRPSVADAAGSGSGRS